MIKDITHYKVEHFFNSDFAKDLVKISIFKNADGSYDLFDKYIINPVGKKYSIVTKHCHDTIDFYSLQNAVAWCIYSQRKKFTEADRINDLDKMIESVNFSILSLKTKLERSGDVESIMIYSSKLSQDEAKRQNLLYELASFRSQANYWQTHRFKAKV